MMFVETAFDSFFENAKFVPEYKISLVNICYSITFDDFLSVFYIFCLKVIFYIS